MSKKYIIEIEEEPFVRKSALHGEDAVYRAVGFKSLVFDQNGLDKLTPIERCNDHEEWYHRGWIDACNMAKELFDIRKICGD